MSKVDFERAAMLMDVIHKISTIGLKNSNLLGMAQEELTEIENTAREERQALIAKREEEARTVKEPAPRTPVFPKDAIDETPTRRV